MSAMTCPVPPKSTGATKRSSPSPDGIGESKVTTTWPAACASAALGARSSPPLFEMMIASTPCVVAFVTNSSCCVGSAHSAGPTNSASSVSSSPSGLGHSVVRLHENDVTRALRDVRRCEVFAGFDDDGLAASALAGGRGFRRRSLTFGRLGRLLLSRRRGPAVRAGRHDQRQYCQERPDSALVVHCPFPPVHIPLFFPLICCLVVTSTTCRNLPVRELRAGSRPAPDLECRDEIRHKDRENEQDADDAHLDVGADVGQAEPVPEVEDDEDRQGDADHLSGAPDRCSRRPGEPSSRSPARSRSPGCLEPIRVELPEARLPTRQRLRMPRTAAASCARR